MSGSEDFIDDRVSRKTLAGLRFNLSQNVDLRVEYERFKLNDTHVDNASAALQLSF